MRVLSGVEYMTKVEDREQSHHKKKCAQKRGLYQICHGKNGIYNRLKPV